MQPNSNKITIGIVAGELSGDNLGAGLIRTLRQYYPQAEFIGIAGPKMMAEDCKTLGQMDVLSLMGVNDAIKRLPQILKIRSAVINTFKANPPAFFIGIDAPDFNLGVEKKLKSFGIPVVHYVSPSIWAWRRWRIKKIQRSIDLLLTLFPFESKFYQQHNVNVHFVGHPLADQIPLENSAVLARKQLSLPTEEQYIALLPGSRSQEIKLLLPTFLQAALICKQRLGKVQFIIPAANADRHQQIMELLQEPQFKKLPVHIVQGQAQKVITAANVVLATSGTVTLETLLINRPLVVAYKFAPLSWWIAKHLVKLPYFSLPNLLAGRQMVPEFVQHEVTPQNLAQALLDWVAQPQRAEKLTEEFASIHQQLRRDASEEAAKAIYELMKSQRSPRHALALQ